jgi:hypothetical protein
MRGLGLRIELRLRLGVKRLSIYVHFREFNAEIFYEIPRVWRMMVGLCLQVTWNLVISLAKSWTSLLKISWHLKVLARRALVY